MANWKKITTDTDLTALSSSLTVTDQAVSASVAALSGSASTARGLLGGTTINTTDSFLPFRTNSTTFSDSFISQPTSGEGGQRVLLLSNAAPFDEAIKLEATSQYAGIKLVAEGTGASSAGVVVSSQDGDITLRSGNAGFGTATNGDINLLANGATSDVVITSNNEIKIDSDDITAGTDVAPNILGVGADGRLQTSTIATDLTAISSSLTVTDQAISASVAALSGSASTARGLITDFPYTGSAEITGSLGVTGSVSFSAEIPTVGASVWSTGGTLSTGREGLAGAGTQSSALAFGGNGPSSATEEYNGSSWSTAGVGVLATARYYLAGAGTQTAGLAFGGFDGFANSAGQCTEEYNGATWSTAGVGPLSDARYGLAGAGTQTAALAFGGFNNVCTEEYNGATWGSGGALSTGRTGLAGAGTQTAGLAFGGYALAGFVSCTEEYNGATWSTGGALATARYRLAGAGTQNAGLAFGGNDSISDTSCTEEYNGASWSSGGALATARRSLAGAGTQNVALAFGGCAGGGGISATEEYSPTSVLALTKTFDYSESTGAVILSQVSSSLNFADDTAAATGGIPLGGLYRNGNFIVIRLT